MEEKKAVNRRTNDQIKKDKIAELEGKIDRAERKIKLWRSEIEILSAPTLSPTEKRQITLAAQKSGLSAEDILKLIADAKK